MRVPRVSMSRSRSSARFRLQTARERFVEKKGERRAVKVAVDDELRETRAPEELLEVLADFHEEHGRFELAERLRRGRDPSV